MAIKGSTNIQLEEGSTATLYEPYCSNMLTIPISKPLCAIGDYKDTVTVKGSQLIITRYIGIQDLKKVTWSLSTSLKFYTKQGARQTVVEDNTPCLCNIYQCVGAVSTTSMLTTDRSICLASGSSSIGQIYLYDTNYPTVTDFNNMIKTIPTFELYYPLDNPITETINIPAQSIPEGQYYIEVVTDIPTHIKAKGKFKK